MNGTEWRVAVGTEETSAVYEPASSGADRAVFVCAHGAGGSMSDRSTLAPRMLYGRAVLESFDSISCTRKKDRVVPIRCRN
jgi:hypothetical protein